MTQTSNPQEEFLARFVEVSPYLKFLGVHFENRGNELTAVLPFQESLIGNPFLPALHGGVTGAFLEVTALTELALATRNPELPLADLPRIPKTIDIAIDYLRSGKPRDSYARAFILRRGRRIANIRVEAWQESREKLIASAHGNFLLPDSDISEP